MTTIAAKLAQAQFQSHVVGKWDAGMATPDHTPEGRGFNSSLVYWEHMNEPFSQRVFAGGTACTLYGAGGYNISDLWDSGAPSRTLNGTAFIEDLHVARMAAILDAASPLDGPPLFLLYTPHIAHYPLRVPRAWLSKYDYMRDDEGACNATTAPFIYPGAPAAQPYVCRQQGAALIGMLDEIVGNLTDAIKAKGWWDETLFIFSSDNGAPLDVEEAGGSNAPPVGPNLWASGTFIARHLYVWAEQYNEDGSSGGGQLWRYAPDVQALYALGAQAAARMALMDGQRRAFQGSSCGGGYGNARVACAAQPGSAKCSPAVLAQASRWAVASNILRITPDTNELSPPPLCTTPDCMMVCSGAGAPWIHPSRNPGAQILENEPR